MAHDISYTLYTKITFLAIVLIFHNPDMSSIELHKYKYIRQE